MISTVDEFERRLTALDPEQVDFVRHADDLIVALSPDLEPVVYEAIFRFFEAHPGADCGAPGTLVHHVERYYPNYLTALRKSVAHIPSYNGVLMINRILNSDTTDQERSELLADLRAVCSRASAPENVRSMAARFLARHK